MISQTVEYALRAMANLASLAGAAATNQAIARATHVPQAYLSKVMRDLVRAELVRSFRGPNGGFILARDAHAITLLDIVNAVDPIRRVDAHHLDDPINAPLRPARRCLDDALTQIEERFRDITLETIIATNNHAADGPTDLAPPPPPRPNAPA